MESVSQVRTITLDDMSVLVREVLAAVRARQGFGARVLALTGELGAGKTTFTKELAKQLGVADDVTSPTFVILKNYQTTDANFKTLTHIDAYRIEDPRELTVLGFEDILKDTERLLVIEWAERVDALLPETAYRMTFSHLDASSRHIAIDTGATTYV